MEGGTNNRIQKDTDATMDELDETDRLLQMQGEPSIAPSTSMSTLSDDHTSLLRGPVDVAFSVEGLYFPGILELSILAP